MLYVGLLALILIYYYYIRSFSYWQRKGVFFLVPSIPLGNIKNPLKSIPFPRQFAEFYNAFKNEGKAYGGFYLFSRPVYMPVDATRIREVYHNLEAFGSRGMYAGEENSPASSNILANEGEEWRKLRSKITSVFSNAKLKMVHNILLNYSHHLRKKVHQLATNNQPIDVKEVADQFTAGVIGSYVYGVDGNSFESETNFLNYSRKILDEGLFSSAKRFFVFVYHDVAKLLKLNIIDKAIHTFFENTTVDIYNYRKKYNIKCNDIMQLLMDLMEEEVDPLTMNELIGQSGIFFLAGFDTSSATVAFCLFELAVNLDIQQKVREEIKNVLKDHNGDTTYEAVQSLKYLDQVVYETLRKHPLVPVSIRAATQDYQLLNTDVVIEKDTRVIISVLGIHRDPRYYPDPEKFDPERFSSDNKHNLVPGTFLGFSDGPRYCIGKRLGLLQTKVCLLAMLKDFEYTVNSRTRVPLELNHGMVATAKGRIWLNVRKLS